MKGGSNIISSIHELKQAVEHFESFQREHPGSKGAKLFQVYKAKINWIYTDMATQPFLPQVVRDGIKQEWNSDVFSVPAINEKIPLLNPAQRDMLETMIDKMLQGEEIIFSEQ